MSSHIVKRRDMYKLSCVAEGEELLSQNYKIPTISNHFPNPLPHKIHTSIYIGEALPAFLIDVIAEKLNLPSNHNPWT